MYVTGLALDLAYAVRGVAKATEKAGYPLSMAKRAQEAILRLEQVAEVVCIPEVGEILAVAHAAELTLNNEAALTEAANTVAAETKKSAEGAEGATLAVLASLIPTPDQSRGTPAS